jgi:hypothetical protein
VDDEIFRYEQHTPKFKHFVAMTMSTRWIRHQETKGRFDPENPEAAAYSTEISLGPSNQIVLVSNN